MPTTHHAQCTSQLRRASGYAFVRLCACITATGLGVFTRRHGRNWIRLRGATNLQGKAQYTEKRGRTRDCVWTRAWLWGACSDLAYFQEPFWYLQRCQFSPGTPGAPRSCATHGVHR